MKWFKHDSDAHRDAKLMRLRIRHGMEGYGLYFYCLELIAGRVETKKLTFELEHDADIISHDTGIHIDKVNLVMGDMVRFGLFEDAYGVITCLKLAKRIDETTAKSPYFKEMREGINKKIAESQEDVGNESGESQEDVGKKSDQIRKDKKRRDKKRKEEVFYPLWLPVDAFEEWLRCRDRLKAINSDRAIKMIIGLLSEIEGSKYSVEDAIDLAIMNGWKSVRLKWLEDRDETNKGNNGGYTKAMQTVEQIARKYDAEEVGSSVVSKING
jgi:hypothetical protein